MSIRKEFCIFIVIFVLVIGCNRETGQDFNTGISKEKNVSELSINERKYLCDGYRSYALRVFASESLCTYAGVTYAMRIKPEDKEARSNKCLSVKKDCLKDIPKLDCPYEPHDFDMCQVPVSTVEKCIEHSIKSGNEVYKEFSCDDALKYQNLDGLLADLKNKFSAKTSSECDEVKKKCVGFAREG